MKTEIRNQRKLQITINIRENKPGELHKNVKLNKNLFKAIKTTYNEKFAMRIEVTRWQLITIINHL